jgi:hypothetical protein
MLLLHYRSLVAPGDDRWMPVDQRWRTVELDPLVFDGLDLTTGQGVAAAIRRINDGVISGLAPFPHGSVVYLMNTDTTDHWNLALTITKAT